MFAMDWESHKSLKHDRKCLKKNTAVEQIGLFEMICSKNDGLTYLIVLPVG